MPDRLIPSVETALRDYRAWAHAFGYASLAHPLPKLKPSWRCFICRNAALRTEAASVALDVANAAASEERIRASVAWA